jgi:uncharacterized protein (DUF2147 family)
MKTFKKITLIFVLLLGFFVNAQTKTTDNFIGKWLTEDKTTTVEFYKENNMYYGKVVKCTMAKTKKGEPSVGQIMVIEMKLKGKNLEKGTIKDIDTNKEYDAKFISIDANKIKLKVTVMLFSHSEVWTRVN